LEELEPFWQDVFEKELEVDDRVPWPYLLHLSFGILQIQSPQRRYKALWMQWKQVHQAWMDGTESIEKAPSKSAWRARFNMCLLVGYSPTPCCMRETVLIMKDWDDIRPPKHHPITMANMVIGLFNL
jgi:hypothetical protein